MGLICIAHADWVAVHPASCGRYGICGLRGRSTVDERAVESGESKAKARGERSMSIIAIELDAEQGQFIAHINSEHLSRDHNDAIRLNYDQALQLYRTLGELIEKYEDAEDKLGN
jgi:hypothetical protein